MANKPPLNAALDALIQSFVDQVMAAIRDAVMAGVVRVRSSDREQNSPSRSPRATKRAGRRSAAPRTRPKRAPVRPHAGAGQERTAPRWGAAPTLVTSPEVLLEALERGADSLPAARESRRAPKAKAAGRGIKALPSLDERGGTTAPGPAASTVSETPGKNGELVLRTAGGGVVIRRKRAADAFGSGHEPPPPGPASQPAETDYTSDTTREP